MVSEKAKRPELMLGVHTWSNVIHTLYCESWRVRAQLGPAHGNSGITSSVLIGSRDRPSMWPSGYREQMEGRSPKTRTFPKTIVMGQQMCVSKGSGVLS